MMMTQKIIIFSILLSLSCSIHEIKQKLNKNIELQGDKIFNKEMLLESRALLIDYLKDDFKINNNDTIYFIETFTSSNGSYSGCLIKNKISHCFSADYFDNEIETIGNPLKDEKIKFIIDKYLNDSIIIVVDISEQQKYTPVTKLIFNVITKNNDEVIAESYLMNNFKLNIIDIRKQYPEIFD